MISNGQFHLTGAHSAWAQGLKGIKMDKVAFSINGVEHSVSLGQYSGHSLAKYIREVAHLTGTKVGRSSST